MKKNLSFFSGILVGALVFGGSVAYASGIIATPIEDTAQRIVLNGQEVEIAGYNINGNNYFKLRDIAAAVDFGVKWDNDTRSVIIDTLVGYTQEETPSLLSGDDPPVHDPSESTWHREDYSQAANPSIFDDGFTRDVYNTIRQTILDRETILADESGVELAYMLADAASRTAMDEATAALGNWPIYSRKTALDEKSTCIVKYPASYTEAAAYCEDFIVGLDGLSDTEKVREIAFYVCDRLTYDAGSTATPRTALTSDGVRPGNCMSYAHNFMFLCNMADIPAIFTHSEDHQWNQVYVDGRWWHVDLTGDDMENDPTVRDWITILHDDAQMQGTSYLLTQPQLVEFAKELLVPGSTV